jgi:hypothetical protein
VDHHDATAIERHLSWCAACRKEARDLERAAATMAFALAPAYPGAQLQERVVGAVRRVAAPSSPPSAGRRRGRRAGVILLAAALVIAGLGVGTVLAGRHGQPVDPATRGAQQEESLAKFEAAIQETIRTAGVADPDIHPQIGMIAAADGGEGAGAALTLASPNADDQVVVWVTGLAAKHAPYLVFLTDRRGDAYEVARINKLDRDGGAMVARTVGRNVSPLQRIVVRDARGHIALSGTLAPAPSAG